MTDVSIRDLRNHGGEVVTRVQAGETLTVTRDGQPVAQIVPLDRAPLNREIVLARWRLLPAIDETRFRADVDSVIDQENW